MKPVRSGLQDVVAGILRTAPAEDAPLLAWPMVCGSAVAAKASAIACQDGVLSVRVSDPGWRAQLDSLASQYVEKLNRILPQKIQAVRFVP